MSMEKIIKQLERENSQQRKNEQIILNEITAVTSLDFAQRAADILEPKKNFYGFEVYLMLLDNLKMLLCAGMPDDLALESVQCGHDAETILTLWRLHKV